MELSGSEEKNIGEVEVKDNQIIFTDKDQKNIYKTGLMNDPNLTDRLYEGGISIDVPSASRKPLPLILLSHWEIIWRRN